MDFISKKPGFKRWTIFIITHKSIFHWLYSKDKDFNLTNFRFVNIAANRFKKTDAVLHRALNLPEQPGFIRLGDHYLETEAIYNVYKNPNLYSELDFIGFIHYDFELRLPDGSCNITERINHYLQNAAKAHISFATDNALIIYNQRMLADETQPDKFCGPGYNCYDYIIRDYNNYFQTNFTLEDLLRKQSINMCSSFLIDIHTFIKMMGFIAHVIESKKLEVFDSLHQFRVQGHLMERYYSVFLAFEYDKFLSLMLPHHTFLKTIG